MAEYDDGMYSAQFQAQTEGPPPYHPSAIKQWVKKVIKYSSQYNNTTWSADQTVGPPKVYPQHGDIHGAWASGAIDKNQFLELEFEVLVKPTAINIYETYNPGAVVCIKCQDLSGNWVVLWSARKPSHQTTSRIFSPELKPVTLKTNVLRIEVDCTAAGTWCEIDAVELVGIRDGAVMQVDDSDFISDMTTLINNKQFSDIKFEIDGKKVYAHKAILAARSSYFSKMFQRQSDKKVDISLPNISHNDILAILHYIYTNRLPDCDPTTLINMTKAAKNFELQGLQPAAMYKLLETISINNVVDTFLAVKDDVAYNELQQICEKFMADNLKEMSKVPAFERLSQHDIVAIIQRATAKMCLDS